MSISSEVGNLRIKMSGWNSSGWNNPYGYPNAGATGFGGAGFGAPRGPHQPMSGMYNMWGPYGGNQMGMVSKNVLTLTCWIIKLKLNTTVSIVT